MNLGNLDQHLGFDHQPRKLCPFLIILAALKLEQRFVSNILRDGSE